MATNNADNTPNVGTPYTINAGTNTISISTDASATTVSIATGAAVKTATFGSTNTTSATAIKSGTGNVAINSGLTIDSSGRNYNTVQPAFLVYLNSSTANNVTGDGTTYKILFDTEIFDQGSNYASSTFTAPITGRYMFGCNVLCANVIAQTTGQYQIATTAQTFEGTYDGPAASKAASNFYYAENKVICSMTASDTAIVNVILSGSTKTVGVVGGLTYTRFWGYLVC